MHAHVSICVRLFLGDILDIAYESIETNLSSDVMKDYIPYAVKYDMSSF